MEKKGISAIVAVVLMILLVVMAIMLIWIVIIPMLGNTLAASEVKTELTRERLLVPYVGGEEGASLLEVQVERGVTELMRLKVENVTVEVEQTMYNKTDILLLVDLSGSMSHNRVPPGSKCMKNNVDLNYQGGYCDSDVSICENENTCNGTYIDGNCTNPLGPWRNFFCYPGDICVDWCGGDVVYNGLRLIDILNESAQLFVESATGLSENISIALMGYFCGPSLGVSNYCLPIDNPYLDFTNDISALKSEVSSWIATANSTYLYEGMNESYYKFENSDADEKFMLVLGDGGINGYDNDDAGDMAKKFSDSGITVHSIGFGANADADLFRGIAGNGSGKYYDSSDTSKLTEIFSSWIGTLEENRINKSEISVRGVFMDIVVYSEGESFTHRIMEDLPGANSARVYDIDLEPSGWKVEDVTMVEVYLVAVTQGNVYNSVLLNRHKVK